MNVDSDIDKTVDDCINNGDASGVDSVVSRKGDFDGDDDNEGDLLNVDSDIDKTTVDDCINDGDASGTDSVVSRKEDFDGDDVIKDGVGDIDEYADDKVTDLFL